MHDDASQPVVVILAAGAGRRFRAAGGRGNKLQADLQGRPVLEWTLAAVYATGLPWVLVEPPAQGADALGMGDSIARGIASRPDSPGWLILPGDMPWIQPDSLVCVARALQAAAAVQPEAVVRPEVGINRQVRPGHPVGFGPAWKGALLDLQGDVGAITLVRSASQQGLLHSLSFQDTGCIDDVDRPVDLSRAMRHIGNRSG